MQVSMIHSPVTYVSVGVSSGQATKPDRPRQVAAQACCPALVGHDALCLERRHCHNCYVRGHVNLCDNNMCIYQCRENVHTMSAFICLASLLCYMTFCSCTSMLAHHCGLVVLLVLYNTTLTKLTGL